ncbi:MAG: ATP-binding protein [Ignavibacteriaceae bacterium]
MEEQKAKILIVEDESIVAFDLKRMLLNLNYDVLDIVASGEKAIKKAVEEKPDLIIMDVMLNGPITGVEAAARIKGVMNVPVIYLTAYADTETLKSAKLTEPYGYILKPFEEKVLLSTVEMAIYKNKIEEKLIASEKKYRLLAKELEDLNEKKDQFYSIISFNLRDPLDSVIGFSEILKNEYKELSPEDIQLYISSLYFSSKQIYSLLNNLIQFSRIQIKDIDFNPVSVNLRKIVEDNSDVLKNTADKKSVKIINYVNKEISVYADANMLNSIFYNLLVNAIKYSYKNGYIEISAAKEGNYIKISIEDKGAGMDKESLDKLFVLNVKKVIPGTNNEMGTGLGLLLTKEFIEKNEGKIEVISEINKGTCVNFTLPISKS